MEYFEFKIHLPKLRRRWLVGLAALLIGAAVFAMLRADWFRSAAHGIVLLSRTKHNDYERATFSFEHGLRDDPDGVTLNDWDLQFGNGGDFFTVTMVNDDCSRIIDLGELAWSAIDLAKLPELPAHPEPAREPPVPAEIGHVYMVHTKDRDTDLQALFRVESLVPGDRCTITWRLISPQGSPPEDPVRQDDTEAESDGNH